MYGPGEDSGSEEFVHSDVAAITKKTKATMFVSGREEADQKKK